MSDSSPVLSRIAPFLEERARQKSPIFYNDLARIFGLPPVGEAWLSHPFFALFGMLDNEDCVKGRPLRTALVVSRQEGIPGEGFFKTMKALRGTQYPIRDEFEKIRVWKEEFDRLVSFYSSPVQPA